MTNASLLASLPALIVAARRPSAWSRRADAGRARRRGAGPRRARPGAASSRQHRRLHDGRRRIPTTRTTGCWCMLNRGQGYRTALATATRGNGGQNEIGPEIFEALGVLRTEELAALHRFDGAEQYFTRAVDFGFSFSLDETFEKWGRDEIIGDFVRLIRTIRPDVITAHDADRHRRRAASSGVGADLSREAFKLAGDPTKYPEQIQGRPASVAAEEVLLHARGSVRRRTPAGDAGEDAARRTCRSTIRCSARPTPKSAPKRAACTSARAWRSCWRCRGRRRRPISWPSRRSRADAEGRDVAVRRHRHARLPASRSSPAPRPPQELVERPGRDRVGRPGRRRRSSTASPHEATLPPLLAGLHAVRALRGQLRSMTLDENGALRDRLPARARRTRVPAGDSPRQRRARRSAGRRRRGRARTAGEGVGAGREQRRVRVTVKQVKFDGFDGDAQCALTRGDRRRRRGGGGGRGGRGGGARRRRRR